MLENILKLDGVVALTKEQQKKVKGGAPGTCNALITNRENGQQVLLADVNRDTVNEVIVEGTGAGYRVQWCCESCHKATWLD